ncbi:MAG: DUF1127 domain-containing protein [Pseudomonadota bacterium]
MATSISSVFTRHTTFGGRLFSRLSPRPSHRVGRGNAVMNRVLLMLQVAGERQRLAQLDARALADLGLDRAAVAREVERPFWDLPRDRL